MSRRKPLNVYIAKMLIAFGAIAVIVSFIDTFNRT